MGKYWECESRFNDRRLGVQDGFTFVLIVISRVVCWLQREKAFAQIIRPLQRLRTTRC